MKRKRSTSGAVLVHTGRDLGVGVNLHEATTELLLLGNVDHCQDDAAIVIFFKYTVV